MNIPVWYSCLSAFSHCRYTLRSLLYIFFHISYFIVINKTSYMYIKTNIRDIVKLSLSFFLVVLPFMVNKDEYILTMSLIVRLGKFST